MQWIQSILGLKPPTTTTQKPPEEALDCPECTRCGVANNGTKIVGKKKEKFNWNFLCDFLLVNPDSTRISGGSETGINQYPWMGNDKI